MIVFNVIMMIMMDYMKMYAFTFRVTFAEKKSLKKAISIGYYLNFHNNPIWFREQIT